MTLHSAVSFERPGKTSGWIQFRPSRKPSPSGRARGPLLTGQPSGAAGALDPVRSAFWQAYRHLFPPHALAAQTADGGIVISWSVQDDPQAYYPYAAPVLLRFDDQVIEAMQRSDPRQQRRIAEHHEADLRAGLRGYDPYARVPHARIVTIG